MRCPECGHSRVYLERRLDWSRFRRWPGLLTPVGWALCLVVGALALTRLMDWPVALLLFGEGMMMIVLGQVNWE